MSRTLLLADENVTTHRIVTLTFAKHDVRVISVVDGIQAIERIERDRPDIILADANLPRLNGYEIAQYVTSRPQLNRMPVLILTGAFDTIDESRVRQSGAAGVIVRPFEPAVVINKVKELFGFGDKLVPAPQVVPRRVPVPATPQSRPPQPREAGPPPVVPRTRPVAVPPARDAELPAPSAAGEQLRHESGPGADLTALERPPRAAEDYFDRLDAAFDTLDAQLAGRLPNRPASARRDAPASFGDAAAPHQRDLRPNGDTTQIADTVAEATDPPVFEVDVDWFAESPRDDEAHPLSAASSQPRSVEPIRSAAVSFPTPTAPPPPPAPAAPPPPAPAALAAPPAPVAPPPPAALAAPAAIVAPAALAAPAAPAEPKYRTAPRGPEAPRAPVAPVLHIADAFDALLEAEERQDQRVISAREQQMREFSDDVIDRIATRVAERLADGVLIDAVRKGVAAITQRLVHDEIERIRTNAQRKT